MRRAASQAGWLLLAMALYLGAVTISAWPALQEWRRTHLTRVVPATGPMAELDGTQIRVAAATALILPDRPDRALIHLRLALTGDPARRAAWLGCDLALADGSGRRWLPLANALGAEVVRVMAGSEGAGLVATRSCAQSLRAEDREAISDQAFLVPVGVVDALRVEFSGLTLRPAGVSIPMTVARRATP